MWYIMRCNDASEEYMMYNNGAGLWQQQDETAADVARRKQHIDIIHLLMSAQHNVWHSVSVCVCMSLSLCPTYGPWEL